GPREASQRDAMRTAVDRDREIVRRESADRIDRYARPLDACGEPVPAERRHARMGRRRPYRTDDREVDVELACARKLVARMTRCANEQIARTRLCAGERGSGPVNTGEPAAPRIFNGSVQQDSRTVVRRERQKAGGECIAPRYRPGFFAKLDQTQAALECALRTRQKFLFTQVFRAGHTANRRQREP